MSTKQRTDTEALLDRIDALSGALLHRTILGALVDGNEAIAAPLFPEEEQNLAHELARRLAPSPEVQGWLASLGHERPPEGKIPAPEGAIEQLLVLAVALGEIRATRRWAWWQDGRQMVGAGIHSLEGALSAIAAAYGQEGRLVGLEADEGADG